MFKKTKDEIEYLKNDNKSKALQITALLKENDDLKYKLHKITMEIDRFNHLEGNPFSLFGVIKKEAKYE
jgi:hypothetical protein